MAVCANCGCKIKGHGNKKYCHVCKQLLTRSEQVTVSFTIDEKNRLKDYAKKSDMNIAEVIRFFLREDDLI